MTAVLEQRIGSERFVKFFPPVEITPVNGNGKDFRYTSPSGKVLSLTRGSGQELPAISWRQTLDAPKGEFFIDVSNRKPLDTIKTDSRVSIAFPPRKNIKEDTTIQGPTVCVEDGEFTLGKSYIEVQKAKKVTAQGSSINNIANVAVAKDGYIDNLWLAGYTYVITKAGSPSTDIQPRGIGTIGSTGFENRINGYKIDGLGIYTAQEFGNYRGTQTRYGRYKDFTDPTTGLLQARAMEMAARHMAKEAERIAARDDRTEEPEIESGVHKEEGQRQTRIVCLECAVLEDTYLTKYLHEAFAGAGITAPTKETEKLAQILTFVANDTDKTPPKGTKIRILTPDALRVLAERKNYPELNQLIITLFDNPDPEQRHLKTYQHVSDIARVNGELGMEILSEIQKVLRPLELARQAQIAAERVQEREAVIASIQRQLRRQGIEPSVPGRDNQEPQPDSETVVFEPRWRGWNILGKLANMVRQV